MAKTARQELGTIGERLIASSISCPRCKRSDRTLRALPTNFKCADIICDFCGYLAQVKTTKVKGELPETCPNKLLGAAWGPQKARMEAGIYFSLFIVVVNGAMETSVFFLPSDLQTQSMFIPRTPLSEEARRPGWQGFIIDFTKALAPPVRYPTFGRTA